MSAIPANDVQTSLTQNCAAKLHFFSHSCKFIHEKNLKKETAYKSDSFNNEAM